MSNIKNIVSKSLKGPHKGCVIIDHGVDAQGVAAGVPERKYIPEGFVIRKEMFRKTEVKLQL